jgi:hypothetical protein
MEAFEVKRDGKRPSASSPQSSSRKRHRTEEMLEYVCPIDMLDQIYPFSKANKPPTSLYTLYATSSMNSQAQPSMFSIHYRHRNNSTRAWLTLN